MGEQRVSPEEKVMGSLESAFTGFKLMTKETVSAIVKISVKFVFLFISLRYKISVSGS